METKRIVCLANSRKPPSGRCIAGKEVVGAGFGAWLRPVSSRPSREISEEERRFEDGTDVQVLDIVDVPLGDPLPDRHQRENRLIDDGYYWARAGRCGWDDLAAAVDGHGDVLWSNGNSSGHGENDRVAETDLGGIDHSLLLVHPHDVHIQVATEGGGLYPVRRRVRAGFRLGDHEYLLSVTDPPVERRYLAGDDGVFPVAEAVICVSLGEVFHGFAYKLAASVILPDR